MREFFQLRSTCILTNSNNSGTEKVSQNESEVLLDSLGLTLSISWPAEALDCMANHSDI